MMYLDLAHDFCILLLCFFFFNDTATTEIYTLSLHDALPSCSSTRSATPPAARPTGACSWPIWSSSADRKSTRLNYSHITSSYAVFCLKKKKKSYHNAACSKITQLQHHHPYYSKIQ